MKSYNITLIAGEASGDHYAAKLINELKNQNIHINFSGIGGAKMQAAGAEIFYDLARFGVTGISDVIKQFNHIFKAMRAVKKYLSSVKPDLLILIDYPGFNLRLAKFAKKKNIKVLYYISPQIWAWKAKRITHIKKYVDHMAVILPFEKKIYTDAKVPVSFVGHPLIEELTTKDNNTVKNNNICALLPGSRKHEIERHLPIFIKVAMKLHKEFPQLKFIIAKAHTISEGLIKKYIPVGQEFINYDCGSSNVILEQAAFCIVASGTASLEAALRILPMCIVYKTSWLSFYLGMKFIKINYLGLCNILSNKLIVPEFIQYDCHEEQIYQFLKKIITTQNLQKLMKKNLDNVKKSLSAQNSDNSLKNIVYDLLTK